MRVALDAQLAVGTATGIGVYERDLARALGAGGTDVRLLQRPALDPWRFDRRVLWDQVAVAAARGAQRRRRAARGVGHAAARAHAADRRRPCTTWRGCACKRTRVPTRARTSATLMKRLYRGAAAVITPIRRSRAMSFSALAGARDERARRVSRASTSASRRSCGGRASARSRSWSARVERRKNLLRAIELLPAVPELELVAVGPPTPYSRRGARARARTRSRRTRERCAATSSARNSTRSMPRRRWRSFPRATKASATRWPRRCARACRSSRRARRR